MAENGNQIGIVFGVEGGSDVGGKSGAKIADQLQKIADQLDGKIKFVASIDKAKTREAILKQLQDIQSDIKLGLPEIDKKSSDKAINSFRSMSKKLSSAMADLTGFGGASFRNQNGFLLDKDLKSFQGSSKEILDKVKRFQTDYSKVAADMSRLQIGGTFSITKDNFQDANKVYQEFENLKLQAKQLRAINATFKAEKTGDLSHLKVLDSVTKYLQKYGDVMSKNTPGSYQRMIELSEKLKGGIFSGQGGVAQQEFLDIATNARLAGGEVETLGQKVKRVFDEKLGYGVLATVALYARQSIIQVYNNVVNLDTAMTELKKVTDETDATYNKFLDNAAERAQDLGATMSDVVTASADFARLGFKIDDASKLADAAIVYKNVGDGISDISTASESIISTLKAFDISADDVMKIVDVYNAIGNTEATSSAGIGEALQRSASALSVAGASVEEASALAAAMNTTVQNSEKVGTTLKTASMYLRAAKTDAEDAGESTEGMAESVSQLRDELKSITGVDIMKDDDTFKGIFQQYRELAAVWNSGRLTDVAKANVLNLLGGKRNADAISGMLNNWEVAERALQTAQNSSGSALFENEKYLDSINGKISQLKAQFEDMSRQVLSSDTVKWVADLLQNVLKVADGLAKVKMLLPAIFSIIATNKGFSLFGFNNKGQRTIFNKTKEQRNLNKFLGLAAGADTFTFGGLLRPGLNLSDKELKALRAFNTEIQTGTHRGEAFRTHIDGSTKSVRKLAFGLNTGKVAMEDIEMATAKASTAMTFFNSLATFGINLIIAALIQGGSYIISKATDWEGKIEELKNKISDSTDKISQYQSEIDSLTSAQEKLTAAKGNKEELVKVQEELNKLLGAAPDLINGEASAYEKAQDKIQEQIELNKKLLKQEQDKIVANNKAIFESNKLKSTGVFGDWSSADKSFSTTRQYAKAINRLAQSYAENFHMSYQEAYEKVFSYRSKFQTGRDGAYYVATDSELEKRFSKEEAKWAKSQKNYIENILGEWEHTVSEADWQSYWNGQVSTALEVFKNTIDNYQGYGGSTFIRNVIEGMVRDGFTLDEINTQINSSELNALNSTYFQGLIDALDEARLKGDTDAAGTALKNIKTAIDNLKTVCPSATTYLDALWDIIANGAKTTEEATEKMSDFLEATKSLTDKFTDIESKKSSIADMLGEVRDDGGLSSKSMTALFEDFPGVEGFEDYIRVLTSSKSSTKQMQDALNGLYSAYINNKGILNDVTEDTLDYTKARLKALGVTNAEEVATGALLNNIIKQASTTGDLTGQQENLIRTTLLQNGATEDQATAYLETAKSCVAAQNTMTRAVGEQTKARLKSMDLELSGIESYADAQKKLRTAAIKEGGSARFSQQKEKYGEEWALRNILGDEVVDEILEYGKQAEAANEAKNKINALLNQLNMGSSNVDIKPSSSSGDSHKDNFDKWYDKLKWQRDNNIIDETNFLQQLDIEYKRYYENRADYLEEYAKYSQEVYEGFKKLYQDDWNAQKEALEKQKDELKELADARKKALEDAKDEEDYKKDQSEKREEINKLKVLIASFRGTLSLSSQKKLRELQQQLKEKEDELNDFEKDKALERAKDQIDKEYESQEKAINEQIKGIDERLEQVNKDLPSIRSAIYDFARQYGVTITRAYASGTSSVPAITQENGAEVIAGNIKRGQFTMLTPTSKVWNASATQALWDFANSPQGYLSSVMDKISSFKQKAMSMIYSQPVNVNIGGITVNGNADNQTVQKIKHSQKEQVEEILKVMKKLQ